MSFSAFHDGPGATARAILISNLIGIIHAMFILCNIIKVTSFLIPQSVKQNVDSASIKSPLGTHLAYRDAAQRISIKMLHQILDAGAL